MHMMAPAPSGTRNTHTQKHLKSTTANALMFLKLPPHSLLSVLYNQVCFFLNLLVNCHLISTAAPPETAQRQILKVAEHL